MKEPANGKERKGRAKGDKRETIKREVKS